MSEQERRLIANIKKYGKKLTPKCAANKKKNRAKRKRIKKGKR